MGPKNQSVYPSLNKKAITQLEVLIAETPNPIAEIIEIWADRLGASSLDVTTWIKLQRAKVPAAKSFASRSGSGSIPRDVEMSAGPSHLPTPAQSTSPETESHNHHDPHRHHNRHEGNGSCTPSPLLSSSSAHFPMSISNTNQYSISEVDIKNESALYSPATSRFQPIPPPPQATPTFPTIPSDAVSIGSASVVSQMMRNAPGDRDDQSCTSPVPPPRPNPNLIASSAPQNWHHDYPRPVPPTTNNIATDMAIDSPLPQFTAPSSLSPVRISRELKLGFSAITSTFTPATVTVADIPGDCPKTVAEFNERFAKYESIMVGCLEKIDSGSLRAFGFEPGTYIDVLDLYARPSFFISGVVSYFHRLMRLYAHSFRVIPLY